MHTSVKMMWTRRAWHALKLEEKEKKNRRQGRKEAEQSQATAGSGWGRNKIINRNAFRSRFHKAGTLRCSRTFRTDSSQGISGRSGPSKPGQ